MRKRNLLLVVLTLLAAFFIALGFNTIDQMMIRYKYYEDWRTIDTWEMSYFWSPNWWDIYIASILMLIAGGMLLGIICLVLVRYDIIA